MKNILQKVLTVVIFPIFCLCVFAQQKTSAGFEKYNKTETVKKADEKLGKNDISGALKILDKAIEKNEDLFDSYRTRSFIRSWYQNDIDGAISDLNKALEIKPEDFDVYISRAYLKKRYKKDYNGALADYETAQKYRPDSTMTYRLKAILKEDLKDIDGALAEIQTALKSYPENIELNVYLTNLLIRKNEFDKAFAHLQTFLKDYSDKREGKLPRIKGEKVIKKIPEAFNKSDDSFNEVPVKRYSKMEFSANSPEELQKQQTELEDARQLTQAFLLLGDMLISKGMFNEALIKLAISLEIDRNQEKAFALRGIIYIIQDKAEKAIPEFSDAIDIVDDPAFYLNRGIAYLLTGNDKKSQKDFDSFMKLYPNGKPILDQRIIEAKQKLQEKINNPQ